MNLAFSENIDDWDRVGNSQSGQSDTWKYMGLESQFFLRKENYSSTKFLALKTVDKQVLKAVDNEFAKGSNLQFNNISKLVVQPFVRRVVAAAVKELGRPGYRYSAKGSEFQPTMKRIKDESLVKASRVYCPLSGIPDIEIVAKYNDTAEDYTVKVEPESSFSFIGPPAVIKSKIEADPGPQIVQAAAYAMYFLLRVFPMLEEEILKDVFGDRCVYTLVLSHRELVLVKLDVSEFLQIENVTVCYSDTLTGTNYVTVLCSWVQWACAVSEKLLKYRDKLNNLKLVNSWVPSTAFMEEFDNVESLEPCPSFYNPMYKSKTHYFRINHSFWCENFGSMVIENLRRFASYFPDHLFTIDGSSFCMGVSDYGDTLCQKKEDLSMQQLKTTLLSVLNLLSILQKHRICHMDIHCANVIVKGNFEEVHLIDFDFATTHRKGNPMSRDRIEYAPEVKVHPNSDMWSIGIMVKKLVCSSESVLSRDDFTKWTFRPPFEKHAKALKDFVNRCLVENPNNRLSVREGLELIDQWDLSNAS